MTACEDIAKTRCCLVHLLIAFFHRSIREGQDTLPISRLISDMMRSDLPMQKGNPVCHA